MAAATEPARSASRGLYPFEQIDDFSKPASIARRSAGTIRQSLG